MRAAPPVAVTVAPSAAWLAALSGLCLATVACTAVWAWQRRDAVGVAAVAAAAIHAVWLVSRAVRAAPRVLRWDGQVWQLQTGPQDAPVAGAVRVALDLGDHLLVQFRAASPSPRRALRTRWLALQRAGLEAPWHGLRCALHAQPPQPHAAVDGRPPQDAR